MTSSATMTIIIGHKDTETGVMAGAQEYIAGYLRRSADALCKVAASTDLQATVGAIADAIARAMQRGNKLLIAGNGGSAADAQHLAAEFLSRFAHHRRPLPALALTTDTSVLTAIGNDYGFEHVFERQVRGLGQAGDVLLVISTSGRSSNVIAGLKAARAIGIETIGLTGRNGGDLHTLCDLCLCAPSDETPIIQQVHIVAGHVICGLVEGAVASPEKA